MKDIERANIASQMRVEESMSEAAQPATTSARNGLLHAAHSMHMVGVVCGWVAAARRFRARVRACCVRVLGATEWTAQKFGMRA